MATGCDEVVAYLLTIELGDPDLDVNLLPATLVVAVCCVLPTLGGDVTLVSTGGGTEETLDLVGLTGAGGVGCWVTDVRRAGTGATVAGVVVVGVGVDVTVDVVTDDGVLATAVVVDTEAVAASLALFSCLILSISSSSCLGAGLIVGGGTADLGLGAGGGVSFFLGLISSISCSLSL